MADVYHDEVEIEDFEFDEDTQTYYYPCPCGDKYVFFIQIAFLADSCNNSYQMTSCYLSCYFSSFTVYSVLVNCHK